MAPPSHDSEEGWFCVRTKPKSEHIAALHLQRFAHLDEVFCPRIRFEKATTRGKVWFVEALFPGYVFARFSLRDDLRAVNATNGVLGVVRFADKYPTIDGDLVAALREEFAECPESVRTIEQELEQGEEVVVTEGAMTGLRTIITKVVPGNERVRILMEWLGEEREVEVSKRSLARPGNIRAALESQ